MPRIDDVLLGCVFYIYPTHDDALNGERIGGGGFLIGIRTQASDNVFHEYAITNKHVVLEAQTPFLRINTLDLKTDIIETKQSDWIFHPDGDDVAVYPISLSWKFHDYGLIVNNTFITQEMIWKYNIGPGDGTIMVGRFIGHDGRQRNTPTVKTGVISMMPLEPVVLPSGIKQDAFLVETRSLGGYSGSPVIVRIPWWELRPDKELIEGKEYHWLLGIDCGHVPIYEDIVDAGGKKLPDLKAKSNSGMMTVIPTWKIQEILDLKELIVQRQEKEEQLENEIKNSIVLDTAEDNGFTEEDFEDALKRASRPREEQSDEEKSET